MSEPFDSRPAGLPEMPFGPRPSGRRRLLFGFGAVGSLAALAGAVSLLTGTTAAPGAPAGHNHGGGPAAATAMPVSLSAEDQGRIGVTYARVARAPIERLVRTVAQVTYDETRITQVVPRIEGYVERLYVNSTGQPVSRGQPLFALYAPSLVSAQQELILASHLTQQVAGGTADASRGAASLLESARTRLLYWDVPPEVVAEVLRTGQVQRTITFRSPVSGVVLEKAVFEGQRLMTGDVAYKVADLRRVWIEGEVFEPDLAAVRVGQQVTAQFPALPGESRTGRITYVYPMLDPETRTARVRVEMANPDMRLKPGMYATFRFSAQTEPLLSVPRSAVLVTGKRSLVFVRDSSGTLQPREVHSGQATDDRIEILSGLAEGEMVVASATFLVDAESNLGSAMAGMANMPGMNPPPPSPASGHQHPAAAPAAQAPEMPDMPGMDHPVGSGKD